MSAAAAGGPSPNRQNPMPGDGLAGGSHASNGFNTGVPNGTGGKIRVFPHIDDLVAARPDVNVLAPIRKLLEKGESCAKQADTHLDFQRPDIALQEYIKASTIIVDVIPRHKDYPELKSDRGDLHRLYAGLQKRINARHEKFEEIKKLIKEDNARSGVQPTASWGLSEDLPASVPHNGVLKSEIVTGSTQSNQKQLLGSQDSHFGGDDFGSSNTVRLPSSIPDLSQSTRRKPPVQPKPDALHGRAIQSNLPLDNHFASPERPERDLAARFSRLRGAGSQSPTQDPRIRTRPIGMPDTADLITKQESTPFPSTLVNITKPRTDRPFGPRDMPKAPTAPPTPKKVPLNVEIPSMPKLPEAIYSPARNVDNPANLDMLRSGSRNAQGAPGKPPSVTSTSRLLHSTTPANERSNNSAKPQKLPYGSGSNKSQAHKSPDASTVTAEELFEYLKRGSDTFSILFVDIRGRGDFNDGHIMSHSIICLEPIVLRHGISAEELGQSLVLSPEAEQSLFDARDTFDLVVYHDQLSISSETKVSGSASGDVQLKDFSKAVYDYGYEKRVKLPPRLLVGGLDAWVDLVGAGALETVQGSDATSIGRMKENAKSFSSTPKSQQANTIMARRVKHGVRTLSKEEQDKWETTLNKEVVAISPNELSYIRTTEDFFRRFPEPSAIQESMVSPSHLSSFQSSSSQVHDVVATDTAVSYPKKSSLVQQIPTRPAPALPRQSYSGVSERTKYSSTTMGTASPFEYKATSTISGDQKIRCGLANLGNTCYMNSLLQALIATRVLYEAVVSLDRTQNPLPLKQGETDEPRQQVILALQTVFTQVASGKETYSPKEFAQYCNQIDINSAFGGSAQQDASEFMVWLLERLQEDFNYSRARGPLLPLTTSQEAVRRQQPDIRSSWMQWQRYYHTHGSVITDNFFGQETHTITCPNCGFVEKAWQAWGHIPLPVNVPSNSSIGINRLLDAYYGQPTVVEDYRCNNCKQKGPERSARISRCPQILIIVLTRYEWKGGKAVRKNTRVQFPLHNLSLDSYFISDEGRGSERLDRGFTAPFNYDCYAVVRHDGNNPQAGHYTCLVKETAKSGKDVWVNYNDRIVTEVEEDIHSTIHNREAYMLFYKRQPNPSTRKNPPEIVESVG